MLIHSAVRAAVIVFCGLSACVPMPGMERVVLRNGFTVDCHHRGMAVEGKVRLFLGSDESSYIDVDMQRVRSFETLADLAPSPVIAPALSDSASGKTIDALLVEQGYVHRLNVELLKSVVQAESAGRPHALSHVGAQGLMQLMPSTAKAMGVTDSFAPDQTLRGGTTYLDQMLLRYHDDLALALAAYNAGPGTVDRYHGVPPYRETQAYVARIIREFNRRSLLAQRAAGAPVQSAQ